MKKTKTAYKEGKFGFYAWNLNAYRHFERKFEDILEQMIKEGIELATSEYSAFVCLASPLNTQDPTMIDICLELAEDNGHHVIWTASLAKIITEYLDWCIGSGPAEAKEIPEQRRLRDALQAAVDKLSERLPQ